VDAVLLSHLHHDHAQLSSLRLLGQTPILTAPANAAWLSAHGLNGTGIDESTWTHLGGGAGVGVRLTAAVHHARPMPIRPNAANGHLIRSPSGGVIWLAGDTALYPELEALAGPGPDAVDVAVVPVAGWGPKLSPGHMGPAEAAAACRQVGARWAVPVHWGTLHTPGGRHIPRRWMDKAGPAFVDAVEREAPGCQPVLLKVGDSVTIELSDS
jgi:L-ascorbate metabolism protein UlaG (beta-lactamase superfamily)